MEVLCKLVEQKKFINRGFLVGPICPIYGYGALFIVLLIGQNKTDLLSIFLKSVFIFSILEYFTSWAMEKLFHARWWDYSKRKFNINGRICLETMVPFGILGCIVIYIIHPIVVNFVNLFSQTTILIVAIVLLLFYLIDNIVSFNVMNQIKKEIRKQKSDNTELIRKKVNRFLESKSMLYRHIKNAYPKFKINYKIVRKKKNGKSI